MTKNLAPKNSNEQQKPQIVDCGAVVTLTKDCENGTKGEPFDLTLVWGN